MSVNYRFNTEAFWNSVNHYAEEMPRNRVEAAKLLLSVIQQKTRPVVAKQGELQGKFVQLVTYRPIVSVSYDQVARKFDYRPYGLGWYLLVRDEWMEYAKVQEMLRLYKAFLPDGFPYAVKQFLLEGGVAGHSTLGTPLYQKLSRTPGDYAAVESEKLFILADSAKQQREATGIL